MSGRPGSSVGAVSCQSIILIECNEIITVERFTAPTEPVYVDGHLEAPTAAETLTFNANVQPTFSTGSREDLSRRTVQEEQVDRQTEGLIIYTIDEMKLSDMVLRNGNRYEVLHVEPWSPYRLCAANFRSRAFKVENE